MASSSHNTFEGSIDDTFDQYFGLPDGGSDFGSGSGFDTGSVSSGCG
uniref:Uncharacterized protein n=1 Tax=Brassica oleracea TaxID=3712 RepID=A0A3P6C221_BRAOL|nr:unnamed protein product [Brassica oleracea]